ncbi:MAG: NYN domain-containing protein [Clostridiales bacterium]|jgi:uncharacterized protein (TIGR00288 family)|nr:NYN domain-containing protein [Clostridiales bacterium]
MEEISDRTIALLIDSDNISQRYLKILIEELSKFGNITYKRVYGDFTADNKKNWKEALLTNGLTPIQQYVYTSSGKNSTDSAMIIDAMDILYKNKIDCICLATSDSDFTRLASRFKEENYVVIGAGESKTPEAFKRVCDRFLLMDILMKDEQGDIQKGTRGAKSDIAGYTGIDEIVASMRKIIEQNADDAGWAHFSAAMNTLYIKHNDFNPLNYGVDQKPINFFRGLPDRPFEFKKDTGVKIKNAEPAAPDTNSGAKTHYKRAGFHNGTQNGNGRL